ncbi:phage terminase large subunit [Rhizobium sp. BK379]|nr:phage terminase large subunit [Rhizobium sp. BK379]
MRLLCIRRFQHRIQDSVYTELKWAIAHLGLEAAYDVQKTTIIHRRTGAEFIFTASSETLAVPLAALATPKRGRSFKNTRFDLSSV